MSPNPYQPPSAYSVDPRNPGVQTPGDRNLFVLAGVGALLASAYWAALTLLIGAASAVANVNPAQVILPLVLIVLYALRGFQLFKGTPPRRRGSSGCTEWAAWSRSFRSCRAACSSWCSTPSRSRFTSSEE